MEIMSCCESPKMNSALLRPALVLAIALTAGMATLLLPTAASPQRRRMGAVINSFHITIIRCKSRRNSDGFRNHTRIGAGLDCEHGAMPRALRHGNTPEEQEL
jgi:hypothetical protein